MRLQDLMPQASQTRAQGEYAAFFRFKPITEPMAIAQKHRTYP